MSEPPIVLIGIVGTGAMGQGIAQLAACAGLSVLLYDSRQGAALQAREQIATVLARQVERGRLEAEAVERAMGNLRVVEDLRVLRGCQLVIEAIVENLEAKQALFRQLEEVVGDEAILASNTSSLSVTAIASACRDPGRVAGLHFFNPVPLMRLVEVIEGLATRTGIAERLCALVATFGHQAVRATDSPGFIVNHAGRAFGTEALRILGEGVAPVAAIDEVLREGAGFRMGPFELFDLVGLDVSLPVMESIYRQYYEEPRYRPHPLLRQMLAAGRLGRKSGQGFYRYDGAGQVPVAAPAVAPGAALPPVWLGVDDEHDRAPLLMLLQRLGAEVESGERPSGAALCLLAPLGADVSAAARRFAVDPTRSLAIDVLSDLERHRCLMACPATRAELQQAARTLFARDGVGVTLIRDSAGFIVQRTLASIVNLACDIAQQGIASVEHIDLAVRLGEGAGFRMGPFELFDLVGLDVSLPVMESIYRQYYEEPRYRPHPLLRQMLAAGRLGRKSGQGFYRYDGAGQVPVAAPAVAPGAALPPVWLGVDDEHDRAPLLMLLQRLGAEVESGERPSGAALCLLAPLGADVSAAARRFAVDPTRSLAIDVLSDLERHRCLMACPATRAELQQAARTLFARDGVGVTLIRDSAGFIVQRTLASIVNLACDIAQQGIASVEHIDLAVRLGLGYPLGPLEWGDRLGAGRVLRILERLHALSGDPRYRPSPWLRRRAQLGLSLRQPDSPLAS